jgi:membrane-associated phospholipid phosphatase
MPGHAYTAAAAPARRLERERSSAGPLNALIVAGLCVVALALVWAVAELIPAVRLKDAVALYEFTTLDRPRVDSLAGFLLHLLDPALFILWGVALVALAMAGNRTRVAVAVAALLALAPLSAELLKPLLAHPHDSVGNVTIGPASWPSGHSTAATILALCAVLIAPSRLRPVVAALGALFVVAIGVSLLILAWHMPSDVLGGVLLGSLWMALALAALRASERVRPSKPDGRREAPVGGDAARS